MSLKVEVERLEKNFDEIKPGMTIDDLLSLPWPEEQVEKFKRALPADGKLSLEQMLDCFDDDCRAEIIIELQKGIRL